MTMMPVTIPERIPLPAVPMGRPASAGTGLTAGDVLRIFKQRVFLILGLWIVITGLTVAGTIYVRRHYPQYQAHSLIDVQSPTPKTPLVFGETGNLTTDLINRYVANQVVLIKDQAILSQALRDNNVITTKWFKQKKDGVDALEDLKEDLSVSQVTGSSYLQVAFSTGDPNDAALIVNTVIEKYMAAVMQSSRDRNYQELLVYKQKLESLEQKLDGVINDKATFLTEKLVTPGVPQGVNVIGEELKAITIEAARVEQEKIQAKAIYDNLSVPDASQVGLSPELLRAIRQDPEVASLQYAKASLEQLLQSTLQQVGEKHRSVEGLRQQLEVTDRRLRELMAEKENEVREYQRNAAHTAYLNAMQQELSLRERLVDVEARQRDLDQGFAKYQYLEDQQEQLEKELEAMREYVGRLQLVQEDRNPVRVYQPFRAQPPDKISFPRFGVMVPAGSLIGLLLGLGLALLLELMDTSIKTPRDVVRYAHVPILGTVPDLDDEEVPIETMELAAHAAPRSMVAEAFRTVRTNLLLSAPAERQRTLLVTSARPEEGKTSIASNLAISVGQSGRRVLLVDANFHRPALQQIFSGTRREGLSNVLVGQGRLAELVSKTGLPNLDVLTCGPIPPNPTELLASSYMRDLLTEATGLYDQVILDGPPLLLVSDGLVLTGLVDGVILVCRAKATSRGMVQRAREQLERVNGRIFGAVLNAAQVRRGGYFREQIRSYYDYQHQEALAGGPAKALPREGDQSKA